ncbi:MAG: hypothetical protein R2877_05785 [Bdellovibrionota bacterium]
MGRKFASILLEFASFFSSSTRQMKGLDVVLAMDLDLQIIAEKMLDGKTVA